MLVPVNTRFTGPEALDVIARSRARALVRGWTRSSGGDRLAAAARRAEQAGCTLPTVVRMPATEQRADDGRGRELDELDRLAADVPSRGAEPRADAVRPDDVSDILFTSGTTGRSKGAMSAHRQSLGGRRGRGPSAAELTSDDRYLVINPFFHSFGYKAGILACLLSGATIVPQAVFDVGEAMRLIVERERITVLPGPPTIYQIDARPPRPRRRTTCPRCGSR